jgi:putative tricarboxylic transport membrane protein
MAPGARQGWLVATGIMLALCLLAVWQSSLLALSDKLGPGPGFFPFWLALIGTAFCLAQLVETWRTPVSAEPGEPILPDAFGRRRIGAIIGAVAIAALVMEVVGFQLTMLAFNIALVVALGERRWLVIVVFAVAGSFGVYQLFTRWLDVLLPTGTLGI